MRSKLIIANWKMHGTLEEARHFILQLTKEVGTVSESIEVAVCPPFTALSAAKKALGASQIKLGAQNCYIGDEGAFTGEVSPAMLVDIGCEYVILGHSERRQYFGETNALVNRKLRSAIDAGIKPIICIGETELERASEQTDAVLLRQISQSLASLNANDATRITIAYEPIWAIGAGTAATPEIAQRAHTLIRNGLREKFGSRAEEIRILYGGSLKPENAKALFSKPDIDGGLVGGASLNAASFLAIIVAAL